MVARYMIGTGVVVLHLALVHSVMQTTEPVAPTAQLETLVGRFDTRTPPALTPTPTPPSLPATPDLPPSPAPSPKPARNKPVQAAAPSTTATQRSLAPVEQTADSVPSPDAQPAPQADSTSAPALNAPVVAVAPAATPEAPAHSTMPRTVSIREVQYLKEPMPVYPSRSQRLGETGEVLLKVLIGTDGYPTQVSVQRSSGFESLDRAAVLAMKAALFKPFSQDGVPQTVWVQTPISFFLEPQS